MKRALWLAVAVLSLGLPATHSQEKAPESPQYSEAFSKAYSEAVELFNRNEFDAALLKLDEADKIQPGISQTLNLRGALFVRLKKLDEAAVVFKKLTDADSKDPIPLFNLGEVFFLQKNYAEAKKLFQKFLDMPDNAQNALGRYKVFLCDLMLGNASEIRKTVDDLRPNVSNPFYYFANSAVAFKKGNKEEGRSFVQSAFSIYNGGLNAAFADSFIELGWLTQEEVGQIGAVDAAALKSLSQETKLSAPEQTQALGNAMESMLPGLEDGDKKKDDKKK